MVNTSLLFTEQEIFLPIMVSLTGDPTKKLQIDWDGRHEGASSNISCGSCVWRLQS
ncbi:hypothetical protein [Sulfitobacter sediminis]|uniref:hypothetical protein n=1 Tax=Sulfitobacter sediminis TaxID=3234186 RepID=UPI003466DB45